jgi:hypothetical protein
MKLIKDPKLQAALVGFLVVVVRHFIPEIDEAALYSVVTVVVAFIMGTSAVEYAEKRDK